MDSNTEDIKKLMTEIIGKAKEYGFDEAACHYSDNESINIDILNGEVSSYENSRDSGFTFKGLKNGQMGTCGTNVIDDDTADYLLSGAMENCGVLDDDDPDFIYCDPDHKELSFSQLSGAYDKNTYDRFKELGLKIEKAILDIDPCVKAVDYLSISASIGPTIMMNTKGLYAFTDSDGITIFAGARAEKDGVVKSGGHFWIGNDIDKFDLDSFIDKVSDNLITKFGASSVRSGSYDTIFKSDAFVSLFAAFFGNFSSFAMQKGLSLLAGKQGTKIASDTLTIREVPMYEKALNKIPFDSEGVLTYEKAIIDKGVFSTALYNLKTAYKDGIKSTGNGFGGNIGVSNIVITPGEKDFDALMETVGNGLIITEVSGLHAGVNAVSGDFSLLSEGFVIENGKKGRPVEQITISGNFYDLIKNITELGNDVENNLGSRGEVFCPSVIIKGVNVAGDGR
ncbi:MAG: TldD/PmbA family protein [Saccharofermentans sp.]|nr:TldD/PmbA family protein [Saccharofermentans sp.]